MKLDKRNTAILLIYLGITFSLCPCGLNQKKNFYLSCRYNKLKAKWSRQADLKAKEGSLYEKLCLLALLNMSFECSATRRQLDFADVSARTGLSADKVELLVMKALSRGLVRGEIDQVRKILLSF